MKARQRASEGVLEVVELTLSSWYNTGREVMTMAQSKAHMAATNRYAKKAYDRFAFDVWRDAEINGDVIRTHAESVGASVIDFIIKAVAVAI